MLNTKPVKVLKLTTGDRVVVGKASNASLNLYMKAKQKGYTFVKCPCNAKTGQLFEVINNFYGGYLLRDPKSDVMIVAHSNDLRRV